MGISGLLVMPASKIVRLLKHEQLKLTDEGFKPTSRLMFKEKTGIPKFINLRVAA